MFGGITVIVITITCLTHWSKHLIAVWQKHLLRYFELVLEESQTRPLNRCLETAGSPMLLFRPTKVLCLQDGVSAFCADGTGEEHHGNLESGVMFKGTVLCFQDHLWLLPRLGRAARSLTLPDEGKRRHGGLCMKLLSSVPTQKSLEEFKTSWRNMSTTPFFYVSLCLSLSLSLSSSFPFSLSLSLSPSPSLFLSLASVLTIISQSSGCQRYGWFICGCEDEELVACIYGSVRIANFHDVIWCVKCGF